MTKRMTIVKRAWTWLPLMAGMAVVLLLSSCTYDNGLLVDNAPDTPTERRYVIGFSEGFVDNSLATRGTRGPVTELSDHSSTMGVWGWRSDAITTDERLFIDHLVTYTPDTDWAYTPLKYWEQHSTYRFSAYAPHSSDTRAAATTVSVDETSGLIAIAPVTLTGDNIRTASNASHELLNTFATSADIDWMVARAGATASGATRNKVQFVMQHILCKFNVRIRLSEALADDPGITDVKIESLSIGSFVASGSFAQQLDHTPNPSSAADMAADEWTLDPAAGTIDLTLKQAAGVGGIDGDYTYILESLLVPQALTDDMPVRLCYSFTYSDGRTEQFPFVMKLSEAFGVGSASGAEGQFVGGSSYTLSFTIMPDIITFDSGVADWTMVLPDASHKVI